ncbi:MAG: hypothetical protein ACMG6E_10615, partial [Candidatus Roizmanbacteria bacterium]
MVNEGVVGVRGVRVDALSLDIIEHELLVVVFGRDEGGFSDSGSLYRVKLLESLPVVELAETDIIDIVMEVGIVLNALMEPCEWVVHVHLFIHSVHQRVQSD